MRSNRKLLFGIAFILAAIVILEIVLYVGNRSSSTPPPANTVATGPTVGPGTPVVLPTGSNMVAQAAMDLPAGTLVAPGMFTMVRKSGASEDVSEYVTSPVDIQGYITRVPLRKGDKIASSALVGHISEVGIPAALAPGKRLMFISIANKPTLHDLVKIGNYVDVIAAYAGQEARPVVMNVRVLTVDDNGADYPPTRAGVRGAGMADPKGGVMPGVAVPPGPNGEPGPTPTPTPVPQNQAPPAAALGLEVDLKQASILQLTQANGASFDFVIRPVLPPIPGTGVVTPEETPSMSEVSVTLPQVAPYGASLKKAPPTTKAPSLPRFTEARGPRTYPTLPPLQSGPTPVPPANFGPVVPPTYNIPIYGDGKLMRTDTVPNPNAVSNPSLPPLN